MYCSLPGLFRELERPHTSFLRLFKKKSNKHLLSTGITLILLALEIQQSQVSHCSHGAYTLGGHQQNTYYLEIKAVKIRHYATEGEGGTIPG